MITDKGGAFYILRNRVQNLYCPCIYTRDDVQEALHACAVQANNVYRVCSSSSANSASSNPALHHEAGLLSYAREFI